MCDFALGIIHHCLWNRLVSAGNHPETERLMQQTTPLANPADSLLPSGLMGTVKILYHTNTP